MANSKVSVAKADPVVPVEDKEEMVPPKVSPVAAPPSHWAKDDDDEDEDDFVAGSGSGAGGVSPTDDDEDEDYDEPVDGEVDNIDITSVIGETDPKVSASSKHRHLFIFLFVCLFVYLCLCLCLCLFCR